MHRRRVTASILALGAFPGELALAQSQPSATAGQAEAGHPTRGKSQAEEAASRLSAAQAREAEAYALGVQTVLWGMQWVKAGRSMRAVSSPDLGGPLGIPEAAKLGINIWYHHRALFDATVRFVETPNTETLMSTVVVDLSDGPIVVVHPEFGDRYFRTSVWELHGDTHQISSKKNGPNPRPHVLVPLGWEKPVPPGLEEVRVRSRYVLLSPHIAVFGADDLPNVHAIQEGFRLVALADWGTSGRAMERGQPMRPIHRSGTTVPAELLFFEELCETLKDITVRQNELAFARQAGRIGVTLEDGFHYEWLDDHSIAGLRRAVLDAQSIVEHRARALAAPQPGGTWLISYDMTNLDDWLMRAAVGWKHVWGDDPSEILFPMVHVDSSGRPLSGERRYIIRFSPGEMPPAKYWRISMYDPDGFFVANSAGRYGIGNMAEKLETGPDGSLVINVQYEPPGEAQRMNWLPAPKGSFFLVIRLYLPDEDMYRGKYILPPLEALD